MVRSFTICFTDNTIINSCAGSHLAPGHITASDFTSGDLTSGDDATRDFAPGDLTTRYRTASHLAPGHITASDFTTGYVTPDHKWRRIWLLTCPSAPRVWNPSDDDGQGGAGAGVLQPFVPVGTGIRSSGRRLYLPAFLLADGTARMLWIGVSTTERNGTPGTQLTAGWAELVVRWSWH